MNHKIMSLAFASLLLCGCKAHKEVELAANPFITHMYTADPSGHVWGDGRLYVYASHDVDPPRGCDLMDRYHVFSTDNLVDWTDHGEILNSSQVEWGRKDGGFMWAPDCAYKNGKYYFYFPHPSGDDWNATWKIGVAVSDKPASGFEVKGYIPDLGDAFAMIDPCVFVDDDGQAYFYYGGGGRCVGAPLKENMMEIAEPLRPMEGLKDFHEAAWVHKHNGLYYLSYADNHVVNGRGANRLNYATSKSPMGPWTYRGIYLEPTGCDTSHGSIVKFKGNWYALYHNQALSGRGNLRSICIDKLEYDKDGNIKLVNQTPKTYDSYKGLAMAGYQGWFNAEGDGCNRGFYHYKGENGFRPGSATIDMWPYTDEYHKTYPTEFKMADGSEARVFSSADSLTVDTHFRWMREYGLDGVFMQRFVSEVKGKSGRCHFDNVLNNAMAAANEYGRAISVMYDLSGMSGEDAEFVLEDAERIAKEHNMFEHRRNPSYLYHNGRPLVAVWGVGFNDKRNYNLSDCEKIIDGLKEQGFSVLIGVPGYWREMKNDTEANPRLHELIKRCDVVMPWFVARYTPDTFGEFKSIVGADAEWCRNAGVDYVPLVFPGFSWKNMYGEETLSIPRQKGKFLQSQIDNALQSGCESLYVAMFDEIDEGTAIFKCATDVPVASDGTQFVPIEKGAAPDTYLKIVGAAARKLKK